MLNKAVNLSGCIVCAYLFIFFKELAEKVGTCVRFVNYL